MTALTSARTTVAAALAGIGVPVHDQPLGVVRAPCIVIAPGSPWIAPRGHVTLEVTAYAPAAAGSGPALDRLEQLVTDVRDALFTAGLVPDDTQRPTQDDAAGLITAVTPITFRTTCR